LAVFTQEKQDAEKAAAQPSCIPGYFDPTSISVCIPTAGNTVTFAGDLGYVVNINVLCKPY